MPDLDRNTATRSLQRRRDSVNVQTLASAETNVVPQPVIATDFPSAWVSVFRDAVRGAGLAWLEPHRAGAREEISLEWWKGQKNITVFVRGYHAEVLKVWGKNINNEMEEVVVVRREQLVDLWRWLTAA